MHTFKLAAVALLAVAAGFATAQVAQKSPASSSNSSSSNTPPADAGAPPKPASSTDPQHIKDPKRGRDAADETAKGSPAAPPEAAQAGSRPRRNSDTKP